MAKLEYLQVDNGTETLFDGDPNVGSLKSTQSKPLNVQLGHTYRLRLRRVSNNAVLRGPLTVTVTDLKDMLIDMAVESMRLEQVINPPQLIF
jgi:hypothetical protein